VNTFLKKRFFAVARNWSVLVCTTLFCLAAVNVSAASVQDIAPTAADAPVMLELVNPEFGNFAAYNANPVNRLVATVGSASEVMYFGLAAERNIDGDPYNNLTISRYRFRVRRITADGTNPVVHGPFNVDNGNANVNSYEDAEYGVYSTTATQNGQLIYEFRPGQAGDYSIEFEDLVPDANNRILVPFWDFTVADENGQAIEGRVWSRSWSFRTPAVTGGDLPLCIWDREFNGQFYSYTEDGFVSRIDFADAGFIGLSFDVAFNTTGPGTTGNLAEDRKSIPGVNATGQAAQHRIFLSLPDESLFPSGDCGSVNAGDAFNCNGPNVYCLDVTVTNPGQVEIILDFDGNGVLDDQDGGLDVSIVYEFEAGMLSACVPWDGMRADGTTVGQTDTVDIIINYSQGIQHWSSYDLEFMRNGFCVETVRPICAQEISSNVLYWDDRDIPEDPGTDAPKDNRDGADCREVPRAWDFFMIGAGQDCTNFRDDDTQGYGDKSTLNTYWFANTQAAFRARVPVIQVTIDGDTGICEGGETILTAIDMSGGTIVSYAWTGPGVTGSTTESITATEPGEYCVTVEGGTGCTTTVCVDVVIIDFEADIFPTDLFICFGDSIQVSEPGSENLVYTWSPSTGIDDVTSNQPTFFPDVTTTYTVTINNLVNGVVNCTALDTLTVTVAPELGLVVNGGGPICDPSTTITATVANSAIIQLTTLPEGTIVGTQTGTTGTFDVAVSGVTNYRVTATNLQGCADTVDFSVTGGPVDIALQDTVVSCLTEDLTLSVQNLDPNDTLTYSWAPADIFEPGTELTDSPEFIGDAGAYTVTLTATNQFGCSTTETLELFVIDELTALSFTTEDDCDGLTIVFTNTSTVGFGYFWLFGDGTFSTEENPIHTYPAVGSYEVTLSLIVDQECIADFTRTITINEPATSTIIITGPDGPLTGPDAPGGGGPDLMLPTVQTCGEDVTFTIDLAASGDDGDVITFTDINGNPLGDGTNVTLSTNGLDTIVVTATSTLGCITMDTVVIENNQIDAAIDASADGLMFCTSTDTTVTVTNNRPGDVLTYQWVDNDIITGPLDGPSVMITSPAEGSVDLMVTVTNQFGCDSMLTVTIMNIPFMPNDFPDVVTPCFAQSFTIMGGPAVPGYTYTYNTGANLDTSDPSNPIGDFTEDTSIEVTITDPMTGCTDVQIIQVDVAPEIGFMAMPADTSVCEPTMVTVMGMTVNANANITWFSDAELTNQIAMGNSVTVDAAEVGQSYMVFGQAIDATTGCSQVVPVTVTVSALNTGLPLNEVDACEGDPAPAIFEPGTFNPALVYTYTPADVIGGAGTNNPTFIGTADAEIEVMILDPATGCTATTTINATYNEFGDVEGNADPEMIFIGESSTLTVTGCEDCTYEWMDAPNGTIDTDGATATVVPDEPGDLEYEVDVSRNGCTQTVIITLRVEDPLCDATRIYLPNAFTPNGDNNNDELYVRSNFSDLITEFRFIVYNRWGQEVFSSSDINERWDGTVDGDDLEPDVYGFWMRAVCPSGEELIQQGNVSILR